MMQSPIYQEAQESKNAKWLWILIALILVGALAFAFFKGIGPFGQFKSDKAVESPTPAAAETVEDTLPSPDPTPEATIDKSKAKVRILNGSGKAGIASSAKDFIESKGYKVASVGNAKDFDFTSTIIKVKQTFKDFQAILVSDLSDKYSTEAGSEFLEASDSADIEVIIGSK